MQPPRRNEAKNLRHVLLRLAEAFVALYVIFDAIAAPLFRPFIAWIIRFRFFLHLEALLEGLPAHAILALLFILYLSADPAKVYGLYLMGTGHLIFGASIFVAAYVVSLALVEQIYRAGKTKLRTLPWFAALTDWLFDCRDRLVSWAKSAPAWIAARRIEAQTRDLVLRWRLRCVTWLASLRT